MSAKRLVSRLAAIAIVVVPPTLTGIAEPGT
jgi:hypothetical protein